MSIFDDSVSQTQFESLENFVDNIDVKVEDIGSDLSFISSSLKNVIKAIKKISEHSELSKDKDFIKLIEEAESDLEIIGENVT